MLSFTKILTPNVKAANKAVVTAGIKSGEVTGRKRSLFLKNDGISIPFLTSILHSESKTHSIWELYSI